VVTLDISLSLRSQDFSLPDRKEGRGDRNLFLYLKRGEVSNMPKVSEERV